MSGETLRAMAFNYRDGHRWDHLDGEAVTKAACEIDQLREALHVAVDAIEATNHRHRSNVEENALRVAKAALSAEGGDSANGSERRQDAR
jgi:hypothetical protein